ncbi:MAG: hypothetical protein AABZ15_00535 [Nitrospirota bacterium]|mgnify:CR=1 FL=1
MTDQNKSTLLLSGASVLVLLVLSSNVFLDDYLAGLGERARRRMHYENTIQKRGLDLHKGMYWKEKE